MPEKDPKYTLARQNNQKGTVEENKGRASPWPTQKKKVELDWSHTWEEAMTALPNKCYSGHHKATEKEDDQETHGKEIWRGRCGQRAPGLAGGRWRRQHKIELDGDEWSVAYAPLSATRHKSSKSRWHIYKDKYIHILYTLRLTGQLFLYIHITIRKQDH